MDVLSDCDTHHSIVSKLHTRAVISQEVMVAQMSGSTTGSDRGSSLLTVLSLEDKPHKLRELITAMMEEGKVRSLAEEMAALLSKTEQGITNRSAKIHVNVCTCKSVGKIEGWGLEPLWIFILLLILLSIVLSARTPLYPM